LHKRRLLELDSLVRCDLAQRGVNVRQMIERDVAHERAADFGVAHVTMQPAKQNEELQECRNYGRQEAKNKIVKHRA
jgi:hypothetical protein